MTPFLGQLPGMCVKSVHVTHIKENHLQININNDLKTKKHRNNMTIVLAHQIEEAATG